MIYIHEVIKSELNVPIIMRIQKRYIINNMLYKLLP